MNQYLRKSARQHHDKSIARTVVLEDEEDPDCVKGYITLCTGSVDFEDVPEETRQHLPSYPIPTVLLARLAVARDYHGQGLGGVLLAEAFRRTLEISEAVGVALIAVDALDDEAKAFYEHHGFVPAPSDPLKLFLPMASVKRALADAGSA